MKKIYLLIALFVAMATITKAQTITRIDSIQYINPSDLLSGNDLSYKSGDTVWIVGNCIFEPCLYAQSGSQGYPQRLSAVLTDTAAGGRAWKGIQVMLDPAAIGMTNAKDSLTALEQAVNFTTNFTYNTIVKCRGIVSNFNGNTQFVLLKTPSVAIGPGNITAPVSVSIDSLMQYNSGTGLQDIQYTTGEKYEGVYVQINFPTVTNVSTTTANRYRWEIKDAAGNAIVIQDNFSGHFTNTNYDMYCTGNNGTSGTPTTFPPTPNQILNGAVLSFVKGVVTQNLNTTTGLKYYSLAPLQLSDIGAPTYAPPVISAVSINPGNPTPSQTVDVFANAVDDSTVTTVECFYAYGLSNTTFTALNMTLQSGATYKATIPATVTDSVYVKYYIKATDNFGHVTYYPDALATNSYYLSIASGVYSIRSIQSRAFSSGKSIYAGDSLVGLNISGIVMATTQNDDLGMITIQEGSAPYSGIVLDGATVAGLHRGEKIHITAAKVNEKFNITTLSNPVFTVVSGNNTLPLPIDTLTIANLISNNHTYAEPFESMLIRFNNVAVIDTNPDYSQAPPKNFGEWSIHPTTSATSGLRCDDYSNNILIGFNTDSLLKQQQLCFVNGILTYAFGNWKMYPRNLSDICGFTTKYQKLISSFSINATSGFVNQTAATIALTLPAGTVVTSLAPAIQFIGQSVSPSLNVAQDFTNPVTYTVTAPDNTTKAYIVTVSVAAGIENLNAGKLAIYPNPTSQSISIHQPLLVNTFEISDVLGKTMIQQNNKLATQQISIDVSALPSGIYFIKTNDINGTVMNGKFVKE
ncbi:MAG: hypothetical protein RIQ33_1649 [Bacteroidota bacterium]